MCVGALQQADADGVVFALPDPSEGACRSAIQLAEARGLPRRLDVVSGILREDAADLRPDLDPERAEPDRRGQPGPAGVTRRQRRVHCCGAAPMRRRLAGRRGGFARLARGEVSEWFKVPLSKSGVRKHRGFESHPLRHPPFAGTRPDPVPWRGRLEA